MIKADEINQKAQEFDIHSSNVQRDYIFGWLLSGIYSFSSLKDILVLKGGNVLRKAYFPSARFSEDLDFTTESGIDETFLMNELNTVCKYIQEKTGVQFDYDQNKIADEQIIKGHKKVYKVRLYFKDFYGNESEMIIRVRLDVTEFDKIYLPTQKRLLIHPYSDLEECKQEINCIKLEEAMADKLKCLLQRRSSFDLFDLVYAVFINNQLAVDKREIVTTFLKKSIFEPSPVAAKNLLLGIPFDFFKSFWDKYIVCPKEIKIPFEKATEILKVGIEELFKDFTYGEYQALAYYPADIRNPILQAGSAMTLLKVTYDNYPRVVEPYSLTYKRRNDGVAQEYLYVWDRTGGNHGPGIKAFLHTGISSIENTDEKFEPKYEVEIAKAGDPTSKSYFSQSFGTGRVSRTFPGFHKTRLPRIRLVRSYSGTTYTIECSYCGKRFKRNTYSTQLNKHKDKYGNDCYGRYGYMV